MLLLEDPDLALVNGRWLDGPASASSLPASQGGPARARRWLGRCLHSVSARRHAALPAEHKERARNEIRDSCKPESNLLSCLRAFKNGVLGHAGVDVVKSREVAVMLRVNVEQQGNRYRLVLHGQLGAEWVPLVEQQWRAILDNAPLASVTLVMSEVEFIDAEGERLLRRMAEGGVDFIVSGCLNRHLVEKLQRQLRATMAGQS